MLYPTHISNAFLEAIRDTPKAVRYLDMRCNTVPNGFEVDETRRNTREFGKID
jgi:hypothetical protein